MAPSLYLPSRVGKTRVLLRAELDARVRDAKLDQGGEARLPLALGDRSPELFEHGGDQARERRVLEPQVAHDLDDVALGGARGDAPARGRVVALLHAPPRGHAEQDPPQ